MREIADRMGVKMDKIGVMDELDNAVSLPAFKTIIIGRPLYDRLTETDLESVFAHELAHIKEKHNLVLLIAVPVIFSQLVLWFTLPVQMFAIAGLAFSRIAFIPFNWLAEIRADQVGARYVGNDSMIHALQSIDGKRMDEHSESHPSLRRRIRRLEKGPVSARWYFVVISFILAGAALAWLLILA
jgi:Zn-dependent protease with chaperone function